MTWAVGHSHYMKITRELQKKYCLLCLQDEELGTAPSSGGKDVVAGPSKGDSTSADKEAAKLEKERKRLEKETEREKQRLEKEQAKAAKDRQKAEREAKRAEKERGKAAKEVLNFLFFCTT